MYSNYNIIKYIYIKFILSWFIFQLEYFIDLLNLFTNRTNYIIIFIFSVHCIVCFQWILIRNLRRCADSRKAAGMIMSWRLLHCLLGFPTGDVDDDAFGEAAPAWSATWLLLKIGSRTKRKTSPSSFLSICSPSWQSSIRSIHIYTVTYPIFRHTHIKAKGPRVLVRFTDALGSCMAALSSEMKSVSIRTYLHIG